MEKLMNRLWEWATRIPTSKCSCGFETRCGLQWRQHRCP